MATKKVFTEVSTESTEKRENEATLKIAGFEYNAPWDVIEREKRERCHIHSPRTSTKANAGIA